MASDQYRVNAVDKAIDILEFLAEQPSGAVLTQISRATGIAKSTVHGIIATLVERGVLVRDSEGTVQFGPLLIALGGTALGRLGLVGVAAPIMAELTQTVQIASFLTVRDGHQAMYVHKVETPSPVRVSSTIGQRVSLVNTAVGRALLTHSPDREALIAASYSEAAGASPDPDHATLHAKLEEIRSKGFASDMEESFPGVRCLAAPIFGSGGQAIAALGISGLTQQVPDDRLPELAAGVIRAAQSISRQVVGFKGHLPVSGE